MSHRVFVLAVLFVSGLTGAHAQSADDRARAPRLLGRALGDGGKCCASLREVRDNIDRIDRAIIALMAERGKYVAEAGRFKADPAAVSAPARVEAIIAKVRTIAREDGLAETSPRRAYRAMIAAFEDYERDEWTRRNAAGANRPK